MASALDQFGRILMESVRDQAIDDWDMILDGRMKSARAQDVRQKLSSLTPDQRETVRALVPQVVDDVIHHLLWTLEQRSGAVRVAVTAPDGAVEQNIAGASDGLAGEVHGDEGWLSRFSKKPRGAF